MSRYLLKEYHPLCMENICQLELLTEEERKLKDKGFMILTGLLQRAGVKNQNGRIYPKHVLERELNRYQKVIREQRAFGEIDHSDTAVINLKNSSHIVIRAFWDGDDIKGVLKVLKTPSGQIVEGIINSGAQIGISSRALGSLQETGQGAIVGEDLDLICWDTVSSPSVENAYLFLKESKEIKDIKYGEILTKSDRIYRAFNMVLSRHNNTLRKLND